MKKISKNPTITRYPSKNKSYVGYCHNRSHRGWLTINSLAKHNCLGKDCPYLERCEHPLWTNENYQTKQIHFKKLQRMKAKIFGREKTDECLCERNDKTGAECLQQPDKECNTDVAV